MVASRASAKAGKSSRARKAADEDRYFGVERKVMSKKSRGPMSTVHVFPSAKMRDEWVERKPEPVADQYGVFSSRKPIGAPDAAALMAKGRTEGGAVHHSLPDGSAGTGARCATRPPWHELGDCDVDLDGITSEIDDVDEDWEGDELEAV